MKLFRSLRGIAVVFPLSMLGLLLVGCGSVQSYDDPINPKRPYAFPGQAPSTAAAPSTTIGSVTQPVTPAVGTPSAMPTPATSSGTPTPVIPVATANPIPAVPVTAVDPATPAPAITDSTPVSPDSLTVLRSGDTVVLSFSDLPANSPMVPVTIELDKDGKITLPYNVTIYAIGKNVRQLEQEIRGEYVPKYFKYLTVSVRPELRYFHVNGEVKAPNMYAWKGEPTVLRAIGAAGGFTDWANRKKVQLKRSNGQQFIINCNEAETDIKKDLPIYPGDYIYVPRKGFISW